MKKNHFTWLTNTMSLLACICFMAFPCAAQKTREKINNVSETKQQVSTNSPYKEEWVSIARHKNPEWFKDAKFGIYTSFGPPTIATQHKTTEWYGWAMYRDTITYWTNAIRAPKASPAFNLHKKMYGDQNKFGYKDFVKLFQPNKFDAEEWANIFQQAGAKFCGPLAVHHDNYLMWDSKVSRWNSKKMAGIDFCGDLEKAIRKRNMKYVMTFHHAFTWWYFYPSYKYDGGQKGNEDLYCRPHSFSPDADSFDEYPDAEFEQLWYDKLDEACTKYKPDLVWFDMGLELLSDEIRKKAYARIFNLAEENNQNVGLCYKVKYQQCIPASAGILDYEKGRSSTMRKEIWVTDTPLGGWYYNGRKSRSARAILEMLADIVSKNGCLLLDVSPKPDGTIPNDQKITLKNIGHWLKLNGEAIYNTRPWVISGEGPTLLAKDGHFNENWESIYTEKDIRFTRSKDNQTIYIIVMNKPSTEHVDVKMLGQCYPYLSAGIKNIELIGSNHVVKWKRNLTELRLSFPENPDINGPLYCYKMTLQ